VLTASGSWLILRSLHSPRRPAQDVANWVMGEVTRALNEDGQTAPSLTARLPHGCWQTCWRSSTPGPISGKIAKTVFEEMYGTGRDSGVIVAEKGLIQVSDTGEIEGIIDGSWRPPGQVEDYRGRQGEGVRLLRRPGDAGEQREGQTRRLVAAHDPVDEFPSNLAGLFEPE